MEDQSECRSLLGLCRHEKGTPLSAAILRAIELSCDVSALQDIVISRLQSGEHVNNEPLACLLREQPNDHLWELAWPKLKSDCHNLCRLYRGKYPDQKVEDVLCEQLWLIHAKNSDPHRREIAETIRDVGTEKALPTLEAIGEKLRSKATAAKHFGGSLREFDALEAATVSSFSELTKTAIREIEQRVSFAEAGDSSSTPRGLPAVVASSKQTLEDLVRGGENSRVEFKATLRTNLHSNARDMKMEQAVLKTIAGFLNSQDGGTLLIGIKDDGTWIGLGSDGFPNDDKTSLHLVNLLRDRVDGPTTLNVNIQFEDYAEGRVLRVECTPATSPTFVKDGTTTGRFFVRHGSSTQELTGSAESQYIQGRFPNR